MLKCVCLTIHQQTRHGRARLGSSCGGHGAEATREVYWWDRTRAVNAQLYIIVVVVDILDCIPIPLSQLRTSRHRSEGLTTRGPQRVHLEQNKGTLQSLRRRPPTQATTTGLTWRRRASVRAPRTRTIRSLWTVEPPPKAGGIKCAWDGWRCRELPYDDPNHHKLLLRDNRPMTQARWRW